MDLLTLLSTVYNRCLSYRASYLAFLLELLDCARKYAKEHNWDEVSPLTRQQATQLVCFVTEAYLPERAKYLLLGRADDEEMVYTAVTQIAQCFHDVVTEEYGFPQKQIAIYPPAASLK